MRPVYKTALMVGMLGAAGLGLSACSSTEVEAPMDEGVCYHVGKDATQKGGLRFNVVARDQPQIEFCAARLEEMRLRFLRLGGTNRDMVGAYQGQFIFIDRGGVKFGKTLTGQRFFALTRTGDGRLAIPGAIQREIDGRPIAIAP
ncbi:hypothetical protein [Brevundimonas sp.]|uniref:hypothetical protein n=1 Tax=Brevundimonas sp. TaxID=1871086 RepID=UPI002FCBA2B0